MFENFKTIWGHSIKINTKALWSDVKKNEKYSEIVSIFDLADYNKDNKIQENEIHLLRKLLSLADTLVSEKREDWSDISIEKNDRRIGKEEAAALVEQVNNGKINVDELAKNQNTKDQILTMYPDAEIFMDGFEFKKKNCTYDVTVYNTRMSTLLDRDNGGGSVGTYVLELKDPQNNTSKLFTLYIDNNFDKNTVKKYIQSFIEQCDNTIIDTLSNETNGICIRDPKRALKTGNDGIYSKMSSPMTAAGAYSSNDDIITLYPENKKLNFQVLVHELGHAKENISGEYDNKAEKLYNLINWNKPIKVKEDYYLANPQEMYAEFFSDYKIIQDKVTKKIEKSFADVTSIMSATEKQAFIQEVSIAVFTGEDVNIGDILNKIGLDKYKDSLGDRINKKISIKFSMAKDCKLRRHLADMQQFSKDPEIAAEFKKLIRQIANDFNNPQGGGKNVVI